MKLKLPTHQVLLVLVLCAAAFSAATAQSPATFGKHKQCRCNTNGRCNLVFKPTNEPQTSECPCNACPKVAHGTPVCSAAGVCDIQCKPGYEKIVRGSIFMCKKSRILSE
jgi:hypothetical protein